MPPHHRRAAPAWRIDDDHLLVRVADQPVLALAPGDRRVRIGLVMPVVGRVVDISVQPATASRSLTDAARRAGLPSQQVEAPAARALVEAAARSGSWSPPSGISLLGAFGGVSFPLLAAAYDQGGSPLDEVPRWAAAALAGRTVAEAARTLFGADGTRTVRRALVDALHPTGSGRVQLTTLALSLVGRRVLQPDRLARVLAAPCVDQPATDLPDTSTLEVAERVVTRWGAERAERLLVGAAARPDGLRMLLTTTAYARQLGDHGPDGPLPSRLDQLHDLHRSLVPTPLPVAPAPAPVAARAARPNATEASGDRRARERRAAPAQPAARRAPHRLLAPPVTAAGPVAPGTSVPRPPHLRPIDGLRVGDLLLVLPRDVTDLARWGRILSNCLADFAPAVAAERSTIIGVHRGSRLTYAVELTPTGLVRQFCGPANRPPRDVDRRDVIGALVDAGLVDRRAAANQPWLHGVRVGRTADGSSA